MYRSKPHESDSAVVAGFGDEWKRFDQSSLSPAELQTIFDDYFAVFPWELLPVNAVGFDLGCGSGRWARLVAPRVGHLHCIDPSDAIEVARRNLAGHSNVSFYRAGVENMPLTQATADFGYSLGVLHHLPDTASALRRAVNPLKPGAPFLVYLYYAMEERPFWFRWLWHASDLIRRVVSHSPLSLRFFLSQALALFLYLPLSRVALLGERCGLDVKNWPLAYYRHRSTYVLRTDALDRFGTRLEKRFTKDQIVSMMENAGLRDIVFSPVAPFWCAVGFRS